MTSDSGQNIRIVGESTLGEGPYNRISIVGKGHAHDRLGCKELSVQGEINVAGDLTCETAVLRGAMTVGNECTIQDAKIMGEAYVENWKSNTSRVWGRLAVDSQCAAEQMVVRGVLDVKGLFNFDKARILSDHSSHIHEMGGHTLEVRRSKYFFFLPRLRKQAVLKAKSIEVDDIDIDFTHAEIVRGSRIKIGKNCRIGKVEYSESLIVEEGAVVEKQEKQECLSV